MIQYLGVISRKEVNDLYGKSVLGLLLYQPAKNHFESQPIKMFEYMAAGIPIVCSAFPLWRRLVEENNCGVCADCTNPNAVRRAIERLLDAPQTSQNMGFNGRKAVLEKYNWASEEQKLVDLYNSL